MPTYREDIRIIRVDSRRVLLFVLVALALIGGSVCMLFQAEEVNRKVGWIGIVFFGGGLVILLLQLLPGAASLTLDGEGFVVRALFRNRAKVRWLDVERFTLFRYNRASFVGYTFVFSYTGKTSPWAAAMGGAQGSLGGLYEVKPPELAALMEEWRVRHSAAPRRSS
jgi:hypothetical protein